MIIPGHFIGGAPYVAAHLRSAHFHGHVWFLIDTGASRTTLLDRDLRLLGVPPAALSPTGQRMIGVGGSVQSLQVQNVEFTFASDSGDLILHQDLWVVQHDLSRLPLPEAARILRIPSVLGRDVINQFHSTCHYRAGTVELSRV